MLQIITSQLGKTTGKAISAFTSENANPRPASFGGCDYMPNFNGAVAKRNGRYLNAFFTERKGLSGMLKT